MKPTMVGRAARLVAVAAVGIAAVTGCGGDDDQADDTPGTRAATTVPATETAPTPTPTTEHTAVQGPATTTATTTIAISAATTAPAADDVQAELAAAAQVPTDLGLPPLSRRPDEGKTVVYMRCSAPVCQNTANQVTSAAERLGWNLSIVDFPPDPAGANEALGRALDQQPDGIMMDGMPVALIQQSLDRAKAENVAVVLGYVVDEPTGPDGNGVVAVISSRDTYNHEAQLAAKWMINDSGGDAQVALFNISAYPSTKYAEDVFVEAIEACEECAVTTVDMQVTDIATNAPSIVVSTLQGNPEIEYAFFILGDLSRGVPAALDTAGIADVKLTGIAPVNVNWQGLREGVDTMWISHGYTGYALMDRLARYFNGDAPVSDLQPSQLFTADNAPDNDDPGIPPTFQDMYAELWQL